MYEYQARLNRVIDGDTIDVMIDLGFRMTAKVRLRLARINTYELNSSDKKERALANLEARHCEGILVTHGPFIVRTHKTGKYGRWIAEVILEDGRNFNDEMRLFHLSLRNYKV